MFGLHQRLVVALAIQEEHAERLMRLDDITIHIICGDPDVQLHFMINNIHCTSVNGTIYPFGLAKVQTGLFRNPQFVKYRYRKRPVCHGDYAGKQNIL